MPYVKRNESNEITGLFARKQDFADEFLPDDNAEVLAYKAPPSPEVFTYKSEIWQRCTESEAELLDASLAEAPAKQRRAWDDSITIEHGSEYFSLLRDSMIAEFGESRTDEILAPSNGG